MKSIAIIFALALSTGIGAQSIFLGPNKWNAEILDLLSVGPGEYVIASKSSYDDGTIIEWFKEDTLYKSHRISPDIAVIDLNKNETNISVEAYTFFDCDVTDPGFVNYLLDTVTVEEIGINTTQNPLPSFVNVKRLRDGTLIVIEGDAQANISDGLKVFVGGTQIAEFGLPNENLTKLAEIDDNIFIYGQDYAFYLNKSTLTFDTLNYLGSTVSKIVSTDEVNKIAVLSDFSVDVIDLESEETISYPFFVGDGAPKDIIYTDQLYMLRSREDNNNEIQYIDDEGQWETQYFSLFYAADYTSMYEMDDGEIWLAGQFTYRPISNTSTFRYGTYIVQKLENLNDSENDLAIEYISAEGNGENLIDFTVKLTNNSDEAQNDVQVFSSSIGGIFCISFYFDFLVDEIQAGEELILTRSVYLLDGSYDGNLCFYTFGSGRNPDLDILDNFSCGMVTNTVEGQKAIPALKIYPNPAVNELYVDGFKNEDHIVISDLNGRQVLSSKYKSNIDVSQLSNGIYILRNLDSNHVMKFLKI